MARHSYKCLALLTLTKAEGAVFLTDEQAARLAHRKATEKARGGGVLLVEPVQFKKGETVALAAPLPKRFLPLVEQVEAA